MNKSAVGLTETIPDDLSETFYEISQLKLPVLITGSFVLKPSLSPVCNFFKSNVMRKSSDFDGLI